MPRVANPPRAKHASAATPHKQQSPLKIPFNDDRQEKAVRFQSRQALHDLQINQIKAAASPVKKLNNYQRAASDSPKTPRTNVSRGKEVIEDGSLTVVGAMTPMKRVPILANFEEWMKMATDNKINATNSWNFALIDYFHDMSLLKEGDGVNFQKASCTLDGCVKIYTSRVDSVATETGKLLSGLADSGNKKSRRDEEEEEQGEGAEDEEGEDGVKKKPKKRAQRSSEATLVPSFASLQLKKFELEFSVDPLFKKASADFDEGGAKGLLLNHLAIDGHGRIVFDSSDDAGDATAEDTVRRESGGAEAQETEEDVKADSEQESAIKPQDKEIDIDSLGLRFFPDLGRLDEQDICPSLKNFDLGDPNGSLDIPFLKAPEEWRQDKEKEDSQNAGLGDKTGILLDEDNAAGFDDDDGALGGFDIGVEAAFGEGGEAWAKEAALEPQMRVHDKLDEPNANGDPASEGMGVGDFDPESNQYAVSLQHQKSSDNHENILSYFDNALQKNWAGPEHWRIRRIKDITKLAAPATSKRKEKEPFEIDFLSPLDPGLAELIYTPAPTTSAISLPKTQWKSKTRNLLPDDKHFNSRQLLRLFLKPKARMGSRRSMQQSHQPAKLEEIPAGEIDEAFWARKENDIQQQLPTPPDEEAAQGNYDANFFQDDGLAFPGGGGPPDDDDDEAFADAREAFSPGVDGGADATAADTQMQTQGIASVLAGNQESAYGSQLVTQSRRLRPEYVQYARTATKVDVRRLKEEMWRGIGFPELKEYSHPSPPLTQGPKPTPMEDIVQETSSSQPEEDDKSLAFTSVMNGLQAVYPKQAMADISTSYCFICLLHLANEKGLVIENQPGLEELKIRRDWTAEITEGGG
ncbi:MAG: hypothetical protein Q9195_005988 [Heterodermia aff. obscurata]